MFIFILNKKELDGYSSEREGLWRGAINAAEAFVEESKNLARVSNIAELTNNIDQLTSKYFN